jgi:hypothetical protein
MKRLKYVKSFENFYEEQSTLLNENNNTLIINSLSKKIYDDLLNQGYKVLLNTTRTSTGQQRLDTHNLIGTKGYPGSYDSSDFYIQVLFKSLEITFNKKQYVSDDNELKGVLDVLKEKYTSDEIQSGWDGNKLIFVTTS